MLDEPINTILALLADQSKKEEFANIVEDSEAYMAKILNGDAGLLQGSRSSVVRVSTAEGLGFDSQWLPKFFPSVYVSILIYHQLLTNSSYYQLL